MPTINGRARKHHKKYKFIVSIDGFGDSVWQSCSELSSETAVIETWEGGALTADKDPGRVTVADVTLVRGATDNEDCWTWYKQVSNAAADSGDVDDAFKRSVDIVQQDRNGKTLRRWRLSMAWPKKFVAGEWDNTADENTMEQLVLCFKFFDRVA